MSGFRRALAALAALVIGAGRWLDAVFSAPPCPDCARLSEGERCLECTWWHAIK